MEKVKESQKEKEGLTVKKSHDEWYQQVIQKAELADYTDVSGCIVFRPYAFSIWENIMQEFDKHIKASGVKNAYFPLFIPEKLLQKEAKHVQGFNPEVAWVTEAGDKKLDERLAIRPTSETIMYPSYSKWIRSWRDLPLRINQWNSVVRWEFKHPVPFLRTREFLWQEGHSAFSSFDEAEKEVLEILNLYIHIYEHILAIPVLRGKKTEKEKFAGALHTYSLEILLPDGKAIQGATSHNLGQNFSRVFDITFLDKDGKKQNVWQTSWGLSTRSIGIIILFHGDDKGLVLPPRVAPYKVVIIPIIFKEKENLVLKKARELEMKLKKFNAILDSSDKTPGWKFNEWELKGVPLRLEIGPRDLEKNHVVLVRRDTGKKEIVKEKYLEKKVAAMLDEIQKNLYNKAKKILQDGIAKARNMQELEMAIKNKKIVLSSWCGSQKCEDLIKEKTQAKSLVMPLEQKKEKVKENKCVACSKQALAEIYFGRSY